MDDGLDFKSEISIVSCWDDIYRWTSRCTVLSFAGCSKALSNIRDSQPSNQVLNVETTAVEEDEKLGICSYTYLRKTMSVTDGSSCAKRSDHFEGSSIANSSSLKSIQVARGRPLICVQRASCEITQRF